jgi:hypothetical protein
VLLNALNKHYERKRRKTMKSLQFIDICNYLHETDTETQLRLLDLMSVLLELTNITGAKGKVGVDSYNGVKYRCPITTIGKTHFAVLKDIKDKH